MKRQLGGMHQGGATAVEFAFVLPVFFLLFYGLLMYGLIFLMRMGLQHAAEDGARAALTFPGNCVGPGATPCTPAEKRAHQLSARLFEAHRVAGIQAGWMAARTGDPVTITTRICRVAQDCGAATDVYSLAGIPAAGSESKVGNPDCGISLTTSCQVVVTVTYDYAAAPFIPRLPGFGLLAPDTLVGQARLLMDGRALAS